MSRFMRTRLLSAAAALLLTATAAADMFGQSSGMTTDVSNSASPNSIASSNSTPRKAATKKSPSTVGNFPVIVPSKLNGGPKADESTNKATDKAANKSGADSSGDNAPPPSPPPPSPQAGRMWLRIREVRTMRWLPPLLFAVVCAAGALFAISLVPQHPEELKGTSRSVTGQIEIALALPILFGVGSLACLALAADFAAVGLLGKVIEVSPTGIWTTARIPSSAASDP